MGTHGAVPRCAGRARALPSAAEEQPLVRSSIERARAFFVPGSRLAVVGVSREARDFSRYVLRELRQHGWDAVPVNPALREVEGVRAFARVVDMDPPADAAIILLPARH